MKKKIFFMALISILSLFFVLSKKTEAEEVTAESLVEEYYSEGTYTKKTQIFLTPETVREFKEHFHVNATSDRTTYYSGDYLLMGDFDGGFDEVNSGYMNDGENMSHFVYSGDINDPIAEKYISVKETSIQQYFIALDDMIGEGYFDQFKKISNTKYVYTVPTVEGGVEEKLHEFLWFSAPGLEDSVFGREEACNYLSQSGVTLVLEEKGNYLSFRILLDVTDIGKVKTADEIRGWQSDSEEGTYIVPEGEELVLSEARVYKGLECFDENNLYPTFTTKFENEYIYRLGNANVVKLGSLFTTDIPVENNADVNLNVVALEGSNVTATFTPNSTNWEDSTVKFSGAGLANITISTCDDNEYNLVVEIVNATNVTAYEELKNKNSVLLNDITMSSGDYYYLSNATLYGNGFTFDMTQGSSDGANYITDCYVFGLSNAKIDNTVIVGAVYTRYGTTAKSDYSRAAVYTFGNCVIENSYISNCAAAVRIQNGNLEIINSTVKGGNYANIDIRGGKVVLDNVTTINQANCNDTAADGTVVVGFGIVVYYEQVPSDTTIDVRNGITQYNYISKSQARKYVTDSNAQDVIDTMFSSSYSQVQYNDGNDVWVNTGILSMSTEVDNENITNVAGYIDESPKLNGVVGYLHTILPNASTINSVVPTYQSSNQGHIAPSYSFDHNINKFEKVEGNNDFCIVDNGVVKISMDDGESFNWNPNVLSVSKNTKKLSYIVSMDGVDYTGKNITFDTMGEYQVVYTYVDTDNYVYDINGNVVRESKTYTQVVDIVVSVIQADAKHAEFTFGKNNQETKVIVVDGKSYVSAVGVEPDNTSWASITVGNQSVYYPIIAAKLTKTSGTSSYAYFPIFENIVTITDYEDEGTGAAITYNTSTLEMPSGLAAVRGYYSTTINWKLNDTNLTIQGPGKIFQWAAAGEAPTTPEVYTYKINKVSYDALCYKSPQVSANRDAYIVVVQYCYVDSTNTSYYYYVGYTMQAFKYTSVCLAPDTLITMADGTQKEIQNLQLGEEVVAWDFYEGKYKVAPISLLQTHSTGNMNVLYLNFEDGTVLKVLGEHGIYDADLNTFIFIDEFDVEEYIGHSFVKKDDESFTTVKLVGYEVKEEYTTAYTILSSEHYNVIAEGMFTVTPAHVGDNFFNPFDVNENMKYDNDAVINDIETYGLYTYADFAHVLTYEQYEALNLAHFKVSVGKGYVTYEGLIYLIEAFINNEDYNV